MSENPKPSRARTMVAFLVAVSLLMLTGALACGGSGVEGTDAVDAEEKAADGAPYTGYWSIPPDGLVHYRLLAISPSGDGYQVRFDTLATHRAEIIDGKLRLQERYSEGSMYAPQLDLVVQDGTATVLQSASPSPYPITLTRLTEQEYQAQFDAMADEQLALTVMGLTGMVEGWAEQHDGRPPEVAEMRADSDFGRFVAEWIVEWPRNPFTAKPMQIGTEPGDLSYSTDGRSFTLTAVASDGSTVGP